MYCVLHSVRPLQVLKATLATKLHMLGSLGMPTCVIRWYSGTLIKPILLIQISSLVFKQVSRRRSQC